MVPWCFQFVRDRLSCLQISPEQPVAGAVNDRQVPVSGTVKLIKSDGTVKIYDQQVAVAGTFNDRQVPVAGTVRVIQSDGTVKIYDRQVPVPDLMEEFPKHLVCGSDSFYIGQKVQALSETDNLRVGETYFLLPRRFFATALSFVAVASLAASPAAARSGFSKTAPFEIEKSPAGCLRIRVSGEFVSGMLERRRVGDAPDEGRRVDGNRVVTTAQLERDYERLVAARQWKPKLETIGESPEKRRRRIVGAPFRRKSSGAHRVHEEQKQATECVSSVKDKARK